MLGDMVWVVDGWWGWCKYIDSEMDYYLCGFFFEMII